MNAQGWVRSVTEKTTDKDCGASRRARWFKKAPRDPDYEAELAKIKAHYEATLELEMAKAKAYIHLQHQRMQ